MNKKDVPWQLLEMIKRRVTRVIDFAVPYTDDGQTTPTGQPVVGTGKEAELDDANAVCSKNRWNKHAVVLDIDKPAWLVPSSTIGNSHLYVDLACSWEDYRLFLMSAERIGLIEPGYLEASMQRGFTTVRLPWVEKQNEVPL